MGKAWGNQYRATRVCIDSYAGSVPSGRICNPGITGELTFNSMIGFLLNMEELLDQMLFPQSFAVSRTFASPPAAVACAAFGSKEEPTGKLATFVVRVLFRQSASWQGSVTWEEAGREENFRSALELLLLMDGALKETMAKRN